MMTALFEAAWRVYPAALLMAAGVLVLIGSVRRGLTDGRRIARDPARAFAIVRAFRIGVVGLCVAGIGAGWCWHVPSLIGLSLIIVGEEVLESSVFIGALRDELSRGRRGALEATKNTKNKMTDERLRHPRGGGDPGNLASAIGMTGFPPPRE